MAIIRANNNTLSSVTALPFATGGLVKLQTTDVTSAQATITFDNTVITDTYDKYILEYQGLKPVTDAASFQSRYSTDNGSSFETGTFSYGYLVRTIGSGVETGGGATPSNYAVSAFQPGNDASYPYNGTFHIDGLRDSSTYLTIRHHFIIRDYANNQHLVAEGYTLSNSVVYNYIEFSFNSGNIADGTFILYGLTK